MNTASKLTTVRNEENTGLTDLQARCAQLEQRYQQIEARSRNERRRFKVQMGLALVAVMGAILVSPSNRAAIAQTTGLTLDQLNTRLTAVENKTQYQSVDSTG